MDMRLEIGPFALIKSATVRLQNRNRVDVQHGPVAFTIVRHIPRTG